MDSTGYVEVSLKDESPQVAYFDDLLLRVIKERGIQENHYDPWGLNLVGIETQPVDRLERKQYNGKEQVADFGLGWNFHDARTLDLQIPRFWQVDPLAGERASWTPYQFGRNNPLLNSDPSGALDGEYYNEKGDHLRSDGISDGKLYVVNKKAETIELPSAEIRGQMGAAVDRSNAPAGDDKRGKHHEEGGVIAVNAEGVSQVYDAPAGAYVDPTSGKNATLDYNSAIQAAWEANGGQVTIASLFHVHPAAAGFRQSLSPEDRTNAVNNAAKGIGLSNSYLLAAGEKKVYIYNATGQKATFPLEKFRNLAPPK